MTLKYAEIMGRVSLTGAERKRIEEKLRREAGRPCRLSRILPAAACLAIVLAAGFFIWQQEPENVTVAPGIIECASSGELSEAVGFEAEEPSLPFEPESVTYAAIGGIAQMDFRSGEERAVYRVSRGAEDNSGDYTVYDSELGLDIDGRAVTLRGFGEEYSLALWAEGGFSYSLSLSIPLSSDAWERLLSGSAGAGRA